MSEKEAKERLELFQQKGQFRDPGDPQFILLDRVFNELPIEKQIESIVSLLKTREFYEWSYRYIEPTKNLIFALKKLFHELDRESLPEWEEEPLFHSVEEGKSYVNCLMDIYETVPVKEKTADLQLILLRAIAKYWSPDLHPDIGPSDVILSYGPEVIWRNQTSKKISYDCFRFICSVYGPETCPLRYSQTKVQKGILEIFRTKLEEPQKYTGFDGHRFAREIDRWVLFEYVPAGIMATLLKARARGLYDDGKQEVAFLEVFDFYNRTPEAIERVKTFMQEIRETEEKDKI